MPIWRDDGEALEEFKKLGEAYHSKGSGHYTTETLDELPSDMDYDQKIRFLNYISKFKRVRGHVNYKQGYKEFSELVKDIPPLNNAKKRVDAFISVFSNDEKEIQEAFKGCFKDTPCKIFWSTNALRVATEFALKNGLTTDLQTNLSNTLSNWNWMRAFCIKSGGGIWNYQSIKKSTDSVNMGFFWSIISKLYARSCKKVAYVFTNRPGLVFEEIEKPELKKNRVRIVYMGMTADSKLQQGTKLDRMVLASKIRGPIRWGNSELADKGDSVRDAMSAYDKTLKKLNPPSEIYRQNVDHTPKRSKDDSEIPTRKKVPIPEPAKEVRYSYDSGSDSESYLDSLPILEPAKKGARFGDDSGSDSEDYLDSLPIMDDKK